MTTKAKSGSTQSKGGAARSSKAKPKTVEYRGLTLKLPDELPPTLLFDITEIEAEDQNPLPLFRMLRSLLGSEQFTAIRNRLDSATEDDDFSDIGDLVPLIFEQYGVSPGEAQASPDS